MNKKLGIGILLSIVLTLLIFQNLYRLSTHKQINAYESDNFVVPKCVKKLALLGCTPHPTAYLKSQGPDSDLRNLKLVDFLDMDYLKDSFKQVLALCDENNIDYLLISYLPVYFIDLHKIVEERLVDIATTFFSIVVPQIELLLSGLIKKYEFKVSVALIFPTKDKLLKTPKVDLTDEDRIRYSVKQLPHLLKINDSALETIIIINNKGSGQNEGIISCLKYEYLFEKQLNYLSLELGKAHFHKYL